MFKRVNLFTAGLLAAMAISAGCTARPNNTRIDYQMGERVKIGPLTYNVIETTWRSQLGNDFRVRLPQDRFLIVNISVTNGGGGQISVPLFSLEDQKGQTYQETDSGDGLENWFGILRQLNPAQTQQGRLIFDVPLGSYKLRVTDGSEPGFERFAWVEIPLHMDTDTSVQSPLPSAPPDAPKPRGPAR